jgi:xylulose-5-phosphate/fructose-6-phosphate phosphoketolase
LHGSDGDIHVCGCKQEGAVTTPFNTTVLEQPARLHLTVDAIGWLPRSGDKGIYLKRQFERRRDIRENGEDLRRLRIGNGGT